MSLCENDLTALGDAPERELQQAWVTLLEEYYDLKGDDPGEEWYLNRDAIRLQNGLSLLEWCLTFLETQYSEIIAQSVRKLGYPFSPLDKDPASAIYRNALQVVINKSRTKFVRLQQLQAQLAEILANKKEYKPPTLDYFENLLVYIEEMQGTSYNFDTLMVSKFVTLEKKYWRQVDYLKQQKAHGR